MDFDLKLNENWVRNKIPELVSVIIPTYNREHLIKKAVNSVLQQGYNNIEVLVVDDSSTDNTASVILGMEDSRVRLIRRIENGGQNAALNTGLSESRGSYIAFLDSDDEWLPEFLTKIISRFAASDKPDVVYCRAAIRQDDGSLVNAMPFELEGSIYKQALSQGYVSHMITLVARRECFKKVGGFDLDFSNCQDDDICLRLAREYCFGLVREDLAVIGKAEDQVSHHSRSFADGWYRLFKKFRNDIIFYCGRKQMGLHLQTCFEYYIQAHSIFGVLKTGLNSLFTYPPSFIWMVSRLFRALINRKKAFN